DRNVELEAQLQDTRLQLAEAQSAYRDANAGFSGNRQFSPGREDTRAIIARYRKAATTITTLNQRNVELEARAGETARALAQAEAARFIIEKLQARNLELEEKFQRLKKAAAYNEKEPAPVEALSIEAAESITAPREEPFVETTTEMAIAETAPLSVEAASNETVAAESLPEDEMMPDTTVIPESAPEESAALPAPADTGDEKEAMSSETILTPPDKAPAPEGPMMLASLEKKTSSQEMIESATPAITASTHDAAENDKELYRIVRSIENMNYALETLQSDSGVTRPTLVEIHEEIRNLKKKILKKIDEGSVTLEDVISSAGNTKSFAFYLIQKGDTPEKIAGKKEVYGDPMLWPLIYRYNQSRLNQPDILTSSPLLIIYKNLPLAEKKDAIKKAAKFGHWDKWTKEDKRVLIEDWIM
ncbi:MAG: hypothetical protein ACE5DR_04870, partial [Thermodesulfobacteriota bacterium]